MVKRISLKSAFSAISLAIYSLSAYAADTFSNDTEFDQILGLDISELTVTSVSKREQKLNDTASAIYVITQEDLQRSGITSIPEALRMVPGLDVARVSANSWAVSSRGFNGALSNKLLVLIDGRSIYTPVFSGVYWDDQSTMIEDIDRIEVIRGPGGSLYGANAVDGVINIITKPAEKTQGNFVSATGMLTGGLLEGRHGGKIDDDTYYRTYAQYSSSGSTDNPSGKSNNDNWYRARTGFRMDGKTTSGDGYTFQGDAYGGKENENFEIPRLTSFTPQLINNDSTSYGANLLGRWTHTLAQDSQLSVQMYVDNYSREELAATQHVNTADIEAQHSIKLNDRNNFIWGGGARVYTEALDGTFTVSVNQPHQTHEILNAFLQDEYALIPKSVFLTLGTKVEYNDYTGVEMEPSSRLSYHFTDDQMVWGAISRAVRIPDAIDEGISAVTQVIPGAPPVVARIVGNPEQESEVLIAYELGHRIQLTNKVSFDSTVYYNTFSRLQTISQPGTAYFKDGTTVVPYQISNLGSGEVYGAETAANWNISAKWRLTGSYTFTKMNLDQAASAVGSSNTTERLAPSHQFSVRSYYNITETVHWDNMLYYVSALTPPVSAYTRYDSRLSWMAAPGVELSLIGRNLLEPRHIEFTAVPEAEINRSVVAQVRWRF